jgi:aspartate aminotransferase
MPHFLDHVPTPGIIRIRDMMFGVEDPFRLDQGDVSFDAPDTVKTALMRAVADNRSHYVQTAGVPRLLELATAKLREKNGIPVGDPGEVMVTNGGIHGLYTTFMALLDPGDEVVVPDPVWPPTVGNVLAARGVPVPCRLHESAGWRYDLDELEAAITPRTKALYVNSPSNPTGGVLTRADLERITAIAEAHGLWIVSDEAYEDVIYTGVGHVSVASLQGAYERTVSIFTLSKTYAITGLRLGYVVAKDPALRERMMKILVFTTSNVSSIVQYGGIGAFEGSQACIEEFRRELKARRDLFYAGVREAAGGVFTGAPPAGAFYAFLKIDPSWKSPDTAQPSVSWAMAEHLIKHGRIGCVPGADFGDNGEGHIRFCFARERAELEGALDSMRALFA